MPFFLVAVSVLSLASVHAATPLSPGVCTASFQDLTVRIERPDGAPVGSRADCLEAGRRLRSRIQESVCRNSSGLGSIRVVWSGETLDAFPLACDEGMGRVAVTATGYLEVVQTDDFTAPDGGSRDFYVEDFDRGRLRIRNPPAVLFSYRPGSVIRARGWLVGDALDLKDGSVLLDDVPAQEVASGTQQALAVLVNFENVGVGCTPAQVEGYLFSTGVALDPYYQENSRGSLSFAGEVIGPVTIPYGQDGSSGCSYYDWAYAADDLAGSLGYDPASYDHRIYVMPSACGVAGKASVNGPRSWIFDCDLNMAYGHEIGHNLGMAHASTVSSEYGDQSDVMGCCLYNHLNAPHRDQFNWLSNANVLEDPSTGVYTLTALDAADTGVQAIKIPRPGMGDYYYVSYRQRLGFDGDLSALYANKVNIHRANGVGSINTYFLQALDDGQTFSENGVNLTLLSHTDTTATVEYSRACVPALPSVSLSPAIGVAQPDAVASYTASIGNRDADCGSTTFALIAAGDGLLTSVTPDTLTIDSGGAGTATVDVAGSLLDGSYVFTVTESRDGVSASATHQIDGEPPGAPAGLSARVRGNKVRLDWLAASDNNVVAAYRVYRSGVFIAELSRLAYVESPGEGTFTYTVTAVDAAGNEGPASDGVDVNTSRGGGGGGGRDKTAPSILTTSPSGLLSTTASSLVVTLEVTTDEQATCRYDVNDRRYDSMANTFTTGDMLVHTDSVEHTSDGVVTWNVRCIDTVGNAMRKSAIITYEVDVSAGEPLARGTAGRR